MSHKDLNFSDLEASTAGDTVMPWGKHKSKTIDAVAESDDGLLYLDWARGQWTGPIRDAIDEYLSTDAMVTELAEAMEMWEGK